MWPAPAELALRLRTGFAAWRARPGVRRARAALRLHGRLLLAIALAVGIASMVVHWA